MKRKRSSLGLLFSILAYVFGGLIALFGIIPLLSSSGSQDDGSLVLCVGFIVVGSIIFFAPMINKYTESKAYGSNSAKVAHLSNNNDNKESAGVDSSLSKQYCNYCGRILRQGANYCGNCGKAVIVPDNESNNHAGSQLFQGHTVIKQQDALSRLGLEPNLDLSELDALEVIRKIEGTLENCFEWCILHAKNLEDGTRAFKSIENNCTQSKLPLAAEIRLEQLLPYYYTKLSGSDLISFIDHMEGHDFERWCASRLIKIGFNNVEVTPGSNDQGVDIIAEKESIKYAIQCKCYSHDLGNKPVQEVFAGKNMYDCHVGVVMTNRYFTAGAKALAQKTGVLLWDRDKIIELIRLTQ